MPKKIKKPISRKPKQKNKNVVNVKINIDNSKKTTARRTPIKPSNMQPFVNFPSFQPTRIQQLEPKSQFTSPDFTKIDDMYQKQFKTYLETTDKSVKDIIEKFDDTLKKNTAPQKKEESKPGASNVYATDEGETVLEEPIAKENINMPPQKQGFQNWSKPNEIKENVLTATISPPLQSNQLQEVLTEAVEGKALNRVDLEDFLKNSSKVQFNRVVKSMTPEQIEKVLKKATMEQIEKVLEKAEPKQKIKIENVLTSQEPTKVVKVVKPPVVKSSIVKPPVVKSSIVKPPVVITQIDNSVEELKNYNKYGEVWKKLNPGKEFNKKIEDHNATAWKAMTTKLEKKLQQEKKKNLTLKEKEKQDKEKKEIEQSNFVSGYANYDDKSPIKSLTNNPLYNTNIFVKPNKSK